MCRNLRMIFLAALTLKMVTLAGSIARADWTAMAFPVQQHDFGTVAVAAKTEFRFPVHNNTGKTLHLRSVRASCGCTTPIIETEYVAPGQVGSILARLNTDTNRGQKSATLTVVIDQPVYTEVRLKVTGYIRQDLVISPGSVEFGKVPAGEASTKSIRMTYAGRTDWAVVDVKSNLPWVTATAELENRSGINATYLLTVKIDPSAPEGSFRDELVVVTNDRAKPRLPVLISGELESNLSVSPQSLALGEIKPGEVLEKRLVIRGKSPFTIESITLEGWQVDFDAPTEEKALHMLTVRLTATGDALGKLTSHLIVKTSGGVSATASSTVMAIVRGQ